MPFSRFLACHIGFDPAGDSLPAVSLSFQMLSMPTAPSPHAVRPAPAGQVVAAAVPQRPLVPPVTFLKPRV